MAEGNVDGVLASLMDSFEGEASSLLPQKGASWTLFFLALLWFLFGSVRSFMLLRSSRVTHQFKLDLAMALRNMTIFILTAIPLMVPGVRRYMPAALWVQYESLPFWFAFVSASNWGETVFWCTDAVVGTLCFVWLAIVMNLLMPGGAVPAGDSGAATHSVSFLGGYSVPLMLAFAISCTYLFFTSFRSTDAKRYALGSFSDLVVTFMNPAQNKDNALSFPGGPIFCTLWMVAIAVALALFCLLPRPDLIFQASERSAMEMAKEKLAYAVVNCGGMQRLLVAYYCHGASELELASAERYIRDMQSEIKVAKSKLDLAYWEAFGRKRKERLLRLQWIFILVDRLIVVLQNLVVRVRTLKLMGQAANYEPMVDQLKEFLEAVDVLGLLMSPALLAGSSEERQVVEQRVRNGCVRADAALLEALNRLQLLRVGEALPVEMAFVDTLREWPILLDHFLQGTPPDLSQRVFPRVTWLPHHAWKLKEQHMNAMRNTTSWTLALMWSIYVRGYSSVCVVTLCYLFNSSLGKLWSRNLNRILGFSMGTTLGNAPAFLLDWANAGSILSQPKDYVTYLVMMGMMWLPASYFLYSGGRWSYACQLIGAIGGSELLKPLKSLDVASGWQVTRFESLVDTFMAIIITFAVDISFAWLFDKGARHKVAESMSGVLDASASLLQGIITWDPRYYQDLEDLRACTDSQTRNETRRMYFEGVVAIELHDAEARSHESTWQMPYKQRLVEDLLLQFEAVRVATYSLLTSAERCDLSKLRQIIRLTLPPELVDRYRQYARVAKGAICQTSRLQRWGFTSEMSFGPSLEGQPPAVLRTHFQGLGAEGRSNDSDAPPVRSWMHRQATRTPCSTCEAAATLQAMHSVLALRLALERVEVLLRDEEFIEFGYWGFAPGSALEALRPEDRKHNCFGKHPRVWRTLSPHAATEQPQDCTTQSTTACLSMHVQDVGHALFCETAVHTCSKRAST